MAIVNRVSCRLAGFDGHGTVSHVKGVILLAIILLAACGEQPAPPTNEAEMAKPAIAAAAVPAKPFLRDVKNELIDFHYGWSAEAAAVPQLANRFSEDMAKGEADLLAGAKADKALREKEGFDFNGYMSSTDYKTAGQSARLLSLIVEVGSYEGGAHGNYGVGSLLWDRAAAREIDFANLFAAAPNMDRLLTQRWCDALNRAREKKRGEPVGSGGLFDDCPKLSDIAIAPADKDGNGRFETIELVASPYVAGPWVEGSYEIELPVTGDLIAAIKSDYRDSFEAQPQ